MKSEFKKYVGCFKTTYSINIWGKIFENKIVAHDKIIVWFFFYIWYSTHQYKYLINNYMYYYYFPNELCISFNR